MPAELNNFTKAMLSPEKVQQKEETKKEKVSVTAAAPEDREKTGAPAKAEAGTKPESKVGKEQVEKLSAELKIMGFSNVLIDKAFLQAKKFELQEMLDVLLQI